MIKTKIIATLGPASAESQTIKALIDNGVDVFRLNFSHGSLEQHSEVLKTLNRVRAEHRHTTAVMGDLCGPKIRMGAIEPEGEILSAGDQVSIIPENRPGSAHEFGTNYERLSAELLVGHRVLVDDGSISLRAVAKENGHILCDVVIGGPMHSHKGINLPDSEISAPSITQHDWRCVDWAVENDLDFLALSFVRSAEEIKQLKSYLKDANCGIKVVPKIERPEAVTHLESIIRVADAVLVARGDLGVEMELAQVPLIQKKITQMCRHLGKPVIVATQMLQSMIKNFSPTRAEVSDVANAVMDLADAVMLSGETAVGQYPIEAARTIGRIATTTEAFLDQQDAVPPMMGAAEELAVTAALARSVAQIVEDISAEMVVVWSQTGSAARLLSKARIEAPIVAFSSEDRACRAMTLHYGVIPRCKPTPANTEEFIEMASHLVLANKWAQVGDRIVIVAGRPLGAAGTTNTIIVHTVTQE